MGKGRIAVVDDDIDTQDLITAHFRPKGYEVTCFLDSESFLEKMDGGNWDVVLVDLQLPRMSGVELTPLIKERSPHLPIILITSTRSAEMALKAIEKGAYDYIVKPFHFPQLQLSVERAMCLRRLKGDIDQLRTQLKDKGRHGTIIGRSPKFLAALDVAKKIARSTASIFIFGESGTGKEVLARYIHAQSRRSKGPFVAINCSAIPENLLESELFGHAKGAFTGAQDKKVGLFEEAEDGTLFLDEIGDLSLALQAKLLRVLQEKKIKRLGENQFRAINCRIISATHKNLAQEVREKRFREDLFFRLNVIPIVIPPLRERSEDILLLAESFLKRFAAENESPAKTFSKEAIQFMLKNPWRGNVRELENTIERAAVLASSSEITLNELQLPTTEIAATPDAGQGQGHGQAFFVPLTHGLPDVDQVVNSYIRFAVERNGGARDRTAAEIGIDRKTLYKRLKLIESARADAGRQEH